MSNYYISHTGVKGMKWGIRKYQDESGKLTGLGKARYQESKAEQTARLESERSKQEFKQQKSLNRQAAKQDAAKRKGRVAAAAALTIIGVMAAKQIMNNIRSNKVAVSKANTAGAIQKKNVEAKNTMRINNNQVAGWLKLNKAGMTRGGYARRK